VWDARSGELLDVLHGHDDYVNSVVYSPDGAKIVAAGYDGTARIFRCELCVASDRLLAIAEGKLAAALSPTEQAEYLRESDVTD
jgi:WD40 repeat protein